MPTGTSSEVTLQQRTKLRATTCGEAKDTLASTVTTVTAADALTVGTGMAMNQLNSRIIMAHCAFSPLILKV